MYVSRINPNEAIGGGGCLCHPIKATDTKGPFVIFDATETDNNLSPHAVLCAGCACAAHDLVLNGEQLDAGEDDIVEAVVVEELEL